MSCLIGEERGFRCLPTNKPGRPYCAKHDPERKQQNREEARRAAIASHARHTRGPGPAALETWESLDAWAATLDFTSEAERARSLREAAARVATGSLTAAQGNAIAALARAAGMKPSVAQEAKKPLLIRVKP